jgi:hypothetical protein
MGPSHTGERTAPSRTGIGCARLGLVGDWLTDPTDGPMSPILDDVYHLYIYL